MEQKSIPVLTKEQIELIKKQNFNNVMDLINFIYNLLDQKQKEEIKAKLIEKPLTEEQLKLLQNINFKSFSEFIDFFQKFF
jgi:hypothetical protein